MRPEFKELSGDKIYQDRMSARRWYLINGYDEFIYQCVEFDFSFTYEAIWSLKAFVIETSELMGSTILTKSSYYKEFNEDLNYNTLEVNPLKYLDKNALRISLNPSEYFTYKKELK